MCTETFLRLPEEKRKRFLDAAWGEFTRVRFADASINQIIQRAGIPRGSFYQYFLSKDDLFGYLLEDVKARFVETFREILRRTEGDLFQALPAFYDLLVGEGNLRQFMVDRCFRIFQINPGLDLQRMIAGKPAEDIPPELLDRIDISRLARQDPACVRRVFLMALGALGRAVMDATLQPERGGAFRRELEEELEIIKYGSLRKSEGP